MFVVQGNIDIAEAVAIVDSIVDRLDDARQQ